MSATPANAQSEIRAEEARERRALAARIVRTYLAPHWKRVALAIGCAVVVALTSAFLMWMLNPVVKRIFVQKRVDSLILIPLLLLVAGLIRGFALVFLVLL